MNTEVRRSRSKDRLDGTSPLSDEILVSIALEGIERAFEDLVAGHLHDAIRVAAEIQDAVFPAHRNLASLQDRTRFSPWFLAITRWQALRVERLERRRPFGRVGRVAPFEPVLEALSHLASNPRLIDAGDELLLAGL